MFFITYKGAKGLDLDDTKIETAFAYAFGLGGGIGLLTICTVVPFMRRKVKEKFNDNGIERVSVSLAQGVVYEMNTRYCFTSDSNFGPTLPLMRLVYTIARAL